MPCIVWIRRHSPLVIFIECNTIGTEAMYVFHWNEKAIITLVEDNITDAYHAISTEDAEQLTSTYYALGQTLRILQLADGHVHTIKTIEGVYKDVSQKLQSLQASDHEEELEHPHGHRIAQLGQHWMRGVSDEEKASLLQQRVSLDPIHEPTGLPLTLVQRLAVNDINIQDYLRYHFKNQSLHSGQTTLRVSQNQWLMPLKQALTLLSNTCDQYQQDTLDRLVNEGHIQLIAASENATSLCIATNNGGFIQLLSYDGFVDLFELIHEFGHCLHFGDDLEVWLNATDLQQESAAITFELETLERLENEPSIINNREILTGINQATLADSRRGFYQHWLWQVHLFELALYSNLICNTKHIDQLWAYHVGDTNNWRHQSHLYIAPFYTICYPFAISANA